MEEDIKMLEKLCNQIIDEDDLDMFEILSPYEIAQAIKNLLTRYKELEEKNKTQLEAFELGKESSRKRIEYDYIPKSKVKEKIEELEEEIKPKQDIHQKLCIEVNKIGTETEYDYAMEELSILDDELREKLIKKRVLQDLLEGSRKDETYS